jgi:ribonuclease Z
MELIFLGTSSMVPTKERNVQSLLVTYKDEGILLDCGEGTQRQMNIMGLNRNKITRILISHWHGDHVAGLIGLLMTIGNAKEGKKIHIYGPKDTKMHFQAMKDMCFFYEKLDIEIHELNPKGMEKFFENDDFELHAALLEHSIPVLGFRFVEKDVYKISKEKMKKHGLKEGPTIGKLQREGKVVVKGETIKLSDIADLSCGKKIAFIFDTVLCNACYEIADDADVLVSEATYGSEHEEKAEAYKHMTVKQAAFIANKAGAKKLILTHFSQRYKTTESLEEEAKTYFPNSICAYDFMKVKI